MSWGAPQHRPMYQPSGYHQAPAYVGGGGPNRSFGYAAPFGGAEAPPGVNAELWQWFLAVDEDRNGRITVDELQRALINGNWSPFNEETCRLMIGMFDRDRSGTIDIHEFEALWKYIQDWKRCFDGFDRDRSGTIDSNELYAALQTFGYRLSADFCRLVVCKFDRTAGGSITFDDFIQACVMLRILTEAFRIKDINQSGMINVSYEQFLEMVLDTTIRK